MRKALLSMVAMMATSGVAMAQNGITIIPDASASGLQVNTMSPNGRYIGGSTYLGNNGFLYDTQEKKMVTFENTSEYGTQVKGISNTGLGVGWNGPAATFEIGDDGNGKMTTYGNETDSAYLFKGISPDGNIIVGNCVFDTYYTKACYFNDGKPVTLPEPSARYLGYGQMGTSAEYVTNDTIITGYIVDDFGAYPSLSWYKNNDGETFSTDVTSRPYYAGTYESTKPYSKFLPAGMSTDGKYMALALTAFNAETWEETHGIGRYNMEADTFEVFNLDPTEDADFYADMDASIDVTGIADDGTIVGYYEPYNGGARIGFIWKTGEKPQYLYKAFPGATTLVDYATNSSDNITCAISADGKYITGFAYTKIADAVDGNEENDEYSYVSYILDTTDPSALTPSDPDAINSANTKVKRPAKVAARYNISGQKVGAKFQGVNVLRMTNGETVKALVK